MDEVTSKTLRWWKKWPLASSLKNQAGELLNAVGVFQALFGHQPHQHASSSIDCNRHAFARPGLRKGKTEFGTPGRSNERGGLT